MSEEQGFLAQLAADPGDDATRLVYADWLDERGDVRGRYLRVELELASLAEHDERIPELEEELNQLRQECSEGWADAAGKRWDVWLLNYRQTRKIQVIKLLRELAPEAVGLKEAKELSEALPARVSANRWRSEAEHDRVRTLEAAHTSPGEPDGVASLSGSGVELSRWVILRPAANPVPRGSGGVAISWERIDRWLAENAPGWISLREGASDEAIRQAETALGFPLPEDLRESYRAHDGSGPHGFFPPSVGVESVLLSLSGVVRAWEMWKQLLEQGTFAGGEPRSAKGIRCEWWNVRWVPFATNTAGNYSCVDLAPTPGGKVGQLISMDHESGEHWLLAPSFRHWLYQFANDLEANVYQYGVCQDTATPGLVRRVPT
jgi:uncharacterized protein (TIGR02996 family)